jgi:hypothetical protein
MFRRDGETFLLGTAIGELPALDVKTEAAAVLAAD